MTLHTFARTALPVTAWKNGGGSTREIASWPPGAGLDDFDWRASIATIAESGPFSTFPGVDRTILLIDGDGVRLRADGIDHRLDRPYTPFAFSGDLALDCVMLGGESTDVNVMSRRHRGRADVQVLTRGGELDVASAGLLLSLRGHWRAGAHQLAEGDGLWWADEPLRWSVEASEPDARLVVMRWTSSDT